MFGDEMKKEKTVDNVGFIIAIELDKFPSWSLERKNMSFASPFECTGQPAQADEFWLKIDFPYCLYMEPVVAVLAGILHDCPEHKQVRFIEYSGKAHYSNLEGNIDKYKIKCFFYTEKIDIKEKVILRLSGKMMIKVDLYHEWSNEIEISRFELMEIEE